MRNHRHQRGSNSFIKLFYEIVFFLRFSRYHRLKEVTVKENTFKVIIRRVSYWKGWHHSHTCTSCQSKNVTFFLSSVPRIPWAFAMTEVCGMILCYIWLLVLLLHKHRYLSYFITRLNMFWLSYIKVIKPCFFLCCFLLNFLLWLL